MLSCFKFFATSVTVLFIMSSAFGQECVYKSGDVNDNGDATPLADVIYAYDYFRGGPLPPVYCTCADFSIFAAGDVNGNCAFNGIDITYLTNYWKGLDIELRHCASCPAPLPDTSLSPSGLDAGIPDSIILGNLDLTPIRAYPGDTISIPVWVKNDEAVAGLNLPLALDTAHIVQWLEGNRMYPISTWSSGSFRPTELDRPSPGFVTQNLLCWRIANADGPCVNTGGVYQQIAEFIVLSLPENNLIGDTIQVTPSSSSRAGVSAFCDSTGLNEWTPAIVGGKIAFATDPTHIGLSRTAFVDTVLWGYAIERELYVTDLGNADLIYEVQESDLWISADPISGRLDPAASDTVTITFDAAILTPGNYNSQIIISSNDSIQSEISLPITLTVIAGPPFGRIEGTVTSQWLNPIPFVIVSINPLGLQDTTDSNGMYSFSPITSQTYDVTFSSPGYFDSLVSGFVLPSYDTVTLDMTMRGLPGVIHVPGQYANIQTAIDAAASGDTILVGPGLYRTHLSYLGKEITVKSSGGPDITILEPDTTLTAIVSFDNYEEVAATLEGFTLRSTTNCYAVKINYSSATIRGNIFRDNSNITSGGAIFSLYGGTVDIVGNDFNGNVSNNNGGAIFAQNGVLVTIADNTFKYNSAPVPNGYSGGAVATLETKTIISGNTFEFNNATGNGGAVSISESDGNIVHHNLFNGNHCRNYGGAVSFWGCDSSEFFNNTVAFNSTENSDYGGGVTKAYSNYMGIYNNIVVQNTGAGFSGINSENLLTYNDVWGNTVDYIGDQPGAGSISADPMFSFPPESFALIEGSPCIDAGDPASPVDPDGSTADMGAFFFGTADYGYLAGTVINGSDQPVAGTLVYLVFPEVVDTTDANGYFFLGRLRCNTTYDIAFSHHDYLESIITGVTLIPDDTTSLNVILTEAPQRGAIGGVVSDSILQPIAGVIVNSNPAGGCDTTDALGGYLLGDLRPQIYDISFSHPLFADSVARNIAVTAGDTTILNIVLGSVFNSFRIFFGNTDQAPIPALIGSTIDIPVWGTTPAGNDEDSICYMSAPLASNDMIIAERLGGTFPDTLVGRWDDRDFQAPNWDNPLPGWTNQTMMAFAYLMPPRDPQNFFWTNGDVVPICTYQMRIANDPSLVGDTLSPFRAGNDPGDPGGIHWGNCGGTELYLPVATYPSLYFLSPSDVGYISGVVTDSLYAPVAEVTVTAIGAQRSATTGVDGNYQLGWLIPGTYTIRFEKYGVIDTIINDVEVTASGNTVLNLQIGPPSGNCNYIPGDINGNGVANGIDVVFAVVYFKGGLSPSVTCPMCPQPHPFYAAGDVNGSCVFNGIDVTFFVRFLKGQVSSLLFCPSCPPPAMAPTIVIPSREKRLDSQ